MTERSSLPAEPAPAVEAPGRDDGSDPQYAHRWLILGVVALAQLMVVLDATIVNIALPSAQADLGFGTDQR